MDKKILNYSAAALIISSSIGMLMIVKKAMKLCK